MSNEIHERLERRRNRVLDLFHDISILRSGIIEREQRIAEIEDEIKRVDRGLEDHNMCPGCGTVRPKGGGIGPPPVPGQWYCVNHRHLKKRTEYA